MKNSILKKWVLLLTFLFVGWGAMTKIVTADEIKTDSGSLQWAANSVVDTDIVYSYSTNNVQNLRALCCALPQPTLMRAFIVLLAIMFTY